MNAPHSPFTMRARLDTQRTAFLAHAAPTLEQRRADLLKLKELILRHRSELEAAVNADYGNRCVHETTIMEIVPIVQTIDYQRRRLRRWMRPQRRSVSMTFQPARAWVQYQPLGVVGIIAPWNYPVSLAITPLATAIAAGNRAMLKPSEFTPATTELLARLLADTFPPEQVSVISGDAEVGQQFASLPFDHLVFTGSTNVGRAVMRAASENLVPVTLELGGKSPVIVDVGHATEQTAKSIAYGKLANAGQTCIAPDYVMLHADAVEDFAKQYDLAVRALYPTGPATPDYSAIINERHHARLTALLDDARAKGARVVDVGANPADADRRAHTMAPKLLLDVRMDMRVMQEEIFGPLLPVLTYRELDEAIAHVNDNPRPLALYWFGDDAQRQRKVLDSTTSGNVSVNTTLMHFAQDDLPFGGVGPSGIGAYHGFEGFRALSHAKGVYRQGALDPTKMLRPPFGKLAERVVGFLLR